jgi:hypothetical protein
MERIMLQVRSMSGKRIRSLAAGVVPVSPRSDHAVMTLHLSMICELRGVLDPD